MLRDDLDTQSVVVEPAFCSVKQALGPNAVPFGYRGIGEEHNSYDEHDVQVIQLRNSKGLEEVRVKLRKNQAEDAARGRDPNNSTVTEYGVGAKGFIEATKQLDATEHFVGSFRVDVQANQNGTATYTATNPTHFESFSYRAGPSWRRGKLIGPINKPMGTTHQTYRWTE